MDSQQQQQQQGTALSLQPYSSMVRHIIDTRSLGTGDGDEGLDGAGGMAGSLGSMHEGEMDSTMQRVSMSEPTLGVERTSPLNLNHYGELGSTGTMSILGTVNVDLSASPQLRSYLETEKDTFMGSSRKFSDDVDGGKNHVTFNLQNSAAQQKTGLNTVTNEAEDIIQSLKKELEEKEEVIIENELKVEELTLILSRLREERTNYQQEINNLKNELEYVNKQLEQSQENNNNNSSSRNVVNDTKYENNKQKDEYIGQLENELSIYREVVHQINDIMLSTGMIEDNANNGEEEDNEDGDKDTSAEVKNKHKERDILENIVGDCEFIISTATKHMAQFSNDKAQLLDKIEEMKSNESDHLKIIELLNDEIQKLNVFKQQAEFDLNNKENDIAEMKKALENMTKKSASDNELKYNNFVAQINDLEGSNKAYESLLKKKSEELINVQRERDILKQDSLNSSEQTVIINDLQARLNEKLKAMAEIKAENNKLKLALSEAVSQYDNQVELNKSFIRDVELKNAQLKEKEQRMTYKEKNQIHREELEKIIDKEIEARDKKKNNISGISSYLLDKPFKKQELMQQSFRSPQSQIIKTPGNSSNLWEHKKELKLMTPSKLLEMSVNTRLNASSSRLPEETIAKSSGRIEKFSKRGDIPVRTSTSYNNKNNSNSISNNLSTSRDNSMKTSYREQAINSTREFVSRYVNPVLSKSSSSLLYKL